MNQHIARTPGPLAMQRCAWLSVARASRRSATSGGPRRTCTGATTNHGRPASGMYPRGAAQNVGTGGCRHIGQRICPCAPLNHHWSMHSWWKAWPQERNLLDSPARCGSRQMAHSEPGRLAQPSRARAGKSQLIMATRRRATSASSSIFASTDIAAEHLQQVTKHETKVAKTTAQSKTINAHVDHGASPCCRLAVCNCWVHHGAVAPRTSIGNTDSIVVVQESRTP
mmetsp:Transcript_126366/g.365820  ORF Transcript_126366/g.365820 Transcript_126366/m.365820 type:complete len:226 (-) Transcript_126366:113-790(-)